MQRTMQSILVNEPDNEPEDRFNCGVLKELTNEMFDETTPWDGKNHVRRDRTHAELVSDAICDGSSMCSLAPRHYDYIMRHVHKWVVRRFGRGAAGSVEHPAYPDLEDQLHSLYGTVFDTFVAFVAGIMEAKPLCRSDIPVVLVTTIVRSFQVVSGVRQRLNQLDEGNPVAFRRWGAQYWDVRRDPPSENWGQDMTDGEGRVLSALIPCAALSYSSRLVTERMREVQRRSAVDALALCVFTRFAVRPTIPTASTEGRRGLDPAMIRGNLVPFFLILEQ